MITLDTHLDLERKTKICCIEDIDKLYNLYLKRHLKMKEFDDLYELPLHKLQRALANVQAHLEREESIKNLMNADGC